MKKILKQFNITLSLFLFSLCICLCNFKPYVYAAENKKCSNFTNHTIKPNQSAFFTTIQKKISDNSLDDDVNYQTIEEVEVNEDNSDLESDSDKNDIPNIYLSEYELYDTPDNCHFKSFMDYRTITDKTSKQFDMQDNEAYTDVNTGLRMVNDRYCIAVGSYYTKTIGKKIDVVLENGTIIPCIFAEAKSDEHTDKLTHRQNPNGSVIEFIVDTPLLDNKVIHSGNIESVNDYFKGEIVEIRVEKEEQ